MRRKRRREYVAYVITCSVDGRRYIGITSQPLYQRWAAHRHHAKRGAVHPLYRAIREHGEVAFTVEHVCSALSWLALLETEAALIRQYGSNTESLGYNVTAGGTTGPLGRHMNGEEREARSVALRRYWSDPERKAARLTSQGMKRTREAQRVALLAKPCKRGHSRHDAYILGNGKRRCRACSAEKYRRLSERHPSAPTPRGGVVYRGTGYANLSAVAKACGHSRSWATAMLRRGEIVAAA